MTPEDVQTLASEDKQTPPSENFQALMGFVENFLGEDFDAAIEFIHPEVVAHEPESLPYGGEYRGKDGFYELMTKIWATVSVEATPVGMHDAGDTIVAVYQGKFTSKASGGSVEMPVSEVYGFTDGLISSANIFYKDSKAFVDELGDE